MSETCVLSTLVLSCENETSSCGGPHHSSWRTPTLQVACSFHFHLHKLSIIHLFSHFHYAISLWVYVLVFLPFFQFGLLHYICFLLCSFISAKHHHLHLILWFSFLSLEVSLHTYLTNWLSSCPVGIFPRSHPIIAKIQIINKVSSLKWENLKSTHIIYYGLFRLELTLDQM